MTQIYCWRYIYSYMYSLASSRFVPVSWHTTFCSLSNVPVCALLLWQLLPELNFFLCMLDKLILFLALFPDRFCNLVQLVCCINPLPCPPPNVATLGERRRADDFGSHPGVGAGGAHLGGAVPLSSQPEVCDLQSLVAEVFHLDPLEDEDWSGRQWWSGKWWGDFGWRMGSRGWWMCVGGDGYVQIGRWVDGKVKGFR